jgi:predicted nucleic acid-binding OB-fold protein
MSKTTSFGYDLNGIVVVKTLGNGQKELRKHAGRKAIIQVVSICVVTLICVSCASAPRADVIIPPDPGYQFGLAGAIPRGFEKRSDESDGPYQKLVKYENPRTGVSLQVSILNKPAVEGRLTEVGEGLSDDAMQQKMAEAGFNPVLTKTVWPPYVRTIRLITVDAHPRPVRYISDRDGVRTVFGYRDGTDAVLITLSAASEKLVKEQEEGFVSFLQSVRILK